MNRDELRAAFDGRPILVLGAGLAVGLTAPAHPVNLIFAALAALTLIRNPIRAALAAGVILGLVLAPAEPIPVRERTFVDTTGQVVGIPRPTPFGQTFNVATSARIWRVSTTAKVLPNLGDRIHVSGVGLPLREGSEAYLLLHGVSGRLEDARMEVLEPGPWPWRAAAAWRADFHRFLHRWMAAEAAAVSEALCFDLNAGVDPVVTDRLKEIGTLHLVVASGMHVLLLAGLMLLLFSKLPIPRPAQIVLIASVLLLYCGATGLTPAVVRASIMAVVGLLAYFAGRERDALSALGVAAVVYLLWLPRQIYDPGFQLSFLTVGAIALFYHPAKRAPNRLVRSTYDTVQVGWVAFLSSAPLLAYYFGTLSVVSLPANLFLGALASMAMVSAFAGYGLSLLIMPVGVGLLTIVTEPVSNLILWTSAHLGGQPWSSIAVPAFSAYLLVPLYGLLLLTWRPRIVQP